MTEEDTIKIQIADQVLAITETVATNIPLTVFLMIALPIIMGLGYLVFIEAAINLAGFLYRTMAGFWGAAK